MTAIPVALFNYEDGGQQANHTYDFTKLALAFNTVDEPPALILLCEAKNWRDNAGEPKYAAAEALSDRLGVPYVVEIGSMNRGPWPPAILWNPNVLTLRRWWQPDDPDTYQDQRNTARFAVRGSRTTAPDRTEFLAWVQHFEPLSGDVRLEEARRISRPGAFRVPVIGGGDLNGTASGPHLPQRDWTTAPFGPRSHKGILGPDGQWGPDTRALDYLIGTWDDTADQRREGCGYHAVAELEWHLDPRQPILPTINDGYDPGGDPLLIDWLLVNEAMRPHVIPGTYTVHTPDLTQPYPSDHRLVTVVLDL